MSNCITYKDLAKHVGHKIVCVKYSNSKISDNDVVTIECETCNEVIWGYSRDDILEKEGQLCI